MSKRLKGIYRNCNPIDMPEGTYRDALNVLIDEKIGAITNEDGNTPSDSLPANHEIIGWTLLPNDTIVLFSTDGSSSHQISTFDGTTVTSVYNNTILNFSTSFPVQADFYVDRFGDTIITWIDGNNPARFLNITSVPATITAQSLSLFPSVTDIPLITVDNVNDTGGNLKSGTYYIAIAFKHDDGTLTNFYDVVGPISIAIGNASDAKSFKGSREIVTSKSIRLSFGDVDDNYEAIKLAIIPNYEGVFAEVQLLPDIPISSTEYTYTGNESFTPGALEEIQIDGAYYDKPKSIHINDDVLYLGNLTEKPDIGYQKYANNITVYATTKDLTNATNGDYDLENSYRDPVNAIYNKGFKRGEVYALYISWILKEGGESKAYHIPGRAEIAGDSAGTSLTGIEDATTGMAFWENLNETYPDNDDWDIFDVTDTQVGTLRPTGGTPVNVRHHRFPEVEDQPIVSGSTYKVLGFRLEDIPLPASIEDQVIGYKIYYADRSSEKRVLDQAINISARLDNSLYQPERNNEDTVSHGVIAPDVYYLHPFYSLHDRKSMSGLTHLKAVMKSNETQTELSAVPYDIQRVKHISFSAVAEAGDKIKAVDAKAYVDSESVPTIYNLTSQGFPNQMNNDRGESKLVVKISPDYVAVNTSLGGKPYYLIDLMSDKDDMYLSFDLQKLSSTGYIHTNLAVLNSGNIFGGDTFICTYTFRANKRHDNVGSYGGVNYVAIHTVICESYANINYRETGDNPWETFYPFDTLWNVAALGWEDGSPLAGWDGVAWSEDIPDVYTYDNFMQYSDNFSLTNTIKFPTIQSKFEETPEEFPTRVIRSSTSTRRLNRNFLPDDYIDLSTKRGELVNLTTYNNILVPHMKRTIVRTKGREELKTGDIRAFLGSGDIFAVKPEELIYSKDGIGGIQDKNHSLSTPYGYYFIDAQSNKFYELSNAGMKDLSESIEPVIRDLTLSNIKLGYDPYYERVLFTFNSQTWSYSPKIKAFISRHSYTPDIYINSQKNFYSAVDNAIYEHHTNNVGSFYGTVYDSEYTYSDNRQPDISKYIMSLLVNSEVLDINGDYQRLKTFNQFQITNAYQDTGVVNIVYFADNPDNPYIGNARKTKNRWLINQFRDTLAIPNGTASADEWKYKKQLEDHYHLVRLIKDNTNNEKINLFDSDLVFKESVR